MSGVIGPSAVAVNIKVFLIVGSVTAKIYLCVHLHGSSEIQVKGRIFRVLRSHAGSSTSATVSHRYQARQLLFFNVDFDYAKKTKCATTTMAPPQCLES